MQMKAPSGQAYNQIIYRDGTTATADANGLVNVPAAFVNDLLSAGFVPSIAASTGAAAAATAISTVGAGLLTAAGIAGGLINRSGPVAAYTDTTDTAAAIIAAVPGVPIGGSFNFVIVNLVAFPGTLAAGVGVTLAGIGVVPPLSVLNVRGIITAAATVLITGVSVAAISWVLPTKYTTDDGTTQTLTGAMVAGANEVEHLSTGGTTPTLTTPTGPNLIAAHPGMQIGQTYTLRIINTNSGTATLAANATGVTLTGDATMGTNTWNEYLVAMTGAATVSLQFVGAGTI